MVQDHYSLHVCGAHFAFDCLYCFRFFFFPFVNLLCNRIIRFKSKQWSKHCPKRNTTAKHMDGNTILLFYFIDYILCEHTHTQPSPPPQSSSHTQTCGTMRFDVVLRMFCCSSISSFFSLISYCVFVCCKNISHCVCIISCIHFRPFVFVLRCATSGVCEREWSKKKYDIISCVRSTQYERIKLTSNFISFHDPQQFLFSHAVQVYLRFSIVFFPRSRHGALLCAQ